ncbi:hypothetical protein TNCV_1156051 [Trichonephila clavipes]|nr:hypothetical protein TNCV_1156051 [Trichonephila clavipes]
MDRLSGIRLKDYKRQNLENEEEATLEESSKNGIDPRGAVLPDLMMMMNKAINKILYDEAHFWLKGYVNKQNCRIWSEAIPQVYVETPLHPEKLTVWCALWAGGILLQKR